MSRSVRLNLRMGEPVCKPNRLLRRPWVIVICVVSAAVVLLAIKWRQEVGRALFPRNWGEVEPGLIYRSGQLSRFLVTRMLRRYGIRVVINLEEETQPFSIDEEAEERACAEPGIEQVRFPLEGDGTGKIENYVGAVTRIHKAVAEETPVLVHCGAGAQRTGGVIAVYRLLVQRKPADFVLNEMQKYGWKPENIQVVDFVNTNMREFAVALVEQGVIGQVPDPLPVLKR